MTQIAVRSSASTQRRQRRRRRLIVVVVDVLFFFFFGALLSSSSPIVVVVDAVKTPDEAIHNADATAVFAAMLEEMENGDASKSSASAEIDLSRKFHQTAIAKLGAQTAMSSQMRKCFEELREKLDLPTKLTPTQLRERLLRHNGGLKAKLLTAIEDARNTLDESFEALLNGTTRLDNGADFGKTQKRKTDAEMRLKDEHEKLVRRSAPPFPPPHRARAERRGGGEGLRNAR